MTSARRGLATRQHDAALYAVSALVAAGVAAISSIPIHAEWGWMAAPAYALGTVATLALVRRGGARDRRLRWTAAGVVLVGVVLVPLALQVGWRAGTEPGLHAQSEVIVTEEAATALLDGRNPYRAEYLDGPLAARPLGTKTHFPYLPAMLAFGLPRAALGEVPLTDARVWFLAGALLAFVPALRRLPEPGDRRLRVSQWFLVAPTGALLAATGGDDLPVVALLFLSMTLVAGGRPAAAGVAGGLAMAMKQTAWLAVPFLVLAAWGRSGGRPRDAGRMALAAGAVAATFVLPALAWDPSAFVEDTVRFPLGIGEQETAAGTPTLGRLLADALPGPAVAITAVLVAAGLGVWSWLLIRRPRPDAASAAARAAVAFGVALLLAPAARVGYLIYPLNLFVWSRLARELPYGARSAPAGEGP